MSGDTLKNPEGGVDLRGKLIEKRLPEEYGKYVVYEDGSLKLFSMEEAHKDQRQKGHRIISAGLYRILSGELVVKHGSESLGILADQNQALIDSPKIKSYILS